MSWSLFRWIWQLEAPVYIGMPPAGSINRCRLYVPARVVWGAVTSELARTQNGENFPDYEEVGRNVAESMRFSYLFPAEQINGEWRAWLPDFRAGHGLIWHRERGKEKNEYPDRAFRARLLSTLARTAIDPESDVAAEGSLRETEIVNCYWRHEGAKERSPVGLVGYVFWRSSVQGQNGPKLPSASELPVELFVGGDVRYGLGKIKRIGLQPSSDFFGREVLLEGSDPIVKTRIVYAHAKARTETVQQAMCGQQELLARWNYNELESTSGTFWQPGSGTARQQRGARIAVVNWAVDKSGHWEEAQASTGQGPAWEGEG